jgi:hypothetical protein
VRQDETNSVGSAAKAFTSLDGVTFDRTTDDATPLTHAGDWEPAYAHRQMTVTGVHVKKTDGFVRFQGGLQGRLTTTGSYLLTLPTGFRPGQTVWIPVALCKDAEVAYGRLSIESNGKVRVQGDMNAARCLVSFEGVSFSLTTGGTNLALLNGWVSYSPRAVKVRLEDGVVRFEGAIQNGTSTTVARLPTSMRPVRTVFLQSDSWGATKGRVYVNSDGYLIVQYPDLDVSSDFTSLDGLSYSL